MTFTKTDIARKVEYWGDQASHIERRLHLGGYRLAEFASDMDRVVRGLRQLQGDIEREIYGDDRTEAGDHRGGFGDENRQHSPVVSVLDGD